MANMSTQLQVALPTRPAGVSTLRGWMTGGQPNTLQLSHLLQICYIGSTFLLAHGRQTKKVSNFKQLLTCLVTPAGLEPAISA